MTSTRSEALRRLTTVGFLLLVSLAAVAQTSGPVQYVYDELGRLVAVIDANGNAAGYTYDAVGNILSVSRYSSTQVSVLSFTPGHGPQGTPVTIYGTGFSATVSQDTVQFNGVAATVVSASANQLVATVPNGATTGPISVTAPAGSVASASNFTVTSSSGVPTITGFTPGIVLAGTPVAIGGTNFDAVPSNDRVSFNATPSLPSSATTTSISAVFPSATTSGRITVATAAGTAVSSQDIFVPFGFHTVADVAYTARTAFGSSQTVTLGTANKIGLLLFDATQGKRVSLNLTNSSFGQHCGLYLYAPNGAELSPDGAPPEGISCASGNNYLESTLLPLTGTYTIGLDPQNSTGSVTIAITDVSDVNGAITIDGPAVTVATTAGRQDAKLSFNALVGQRIFLQITSVTNPAATIHLVTPNGETMLASANINNSPAGQLFVMDTQTLPTSGTYKLWVQHNGTGYGSETLQLTTVPPDFTSSITPGGPAVRVPASGNTAIGQNGLLTFNANANQKVSLNVTNATYSPYSACLVSVHGPSYNASNYNCGAGAPSFIDTLTLPNAGAYTILVDPQGIATGTTTVKLNDASDVTGTIYIDGAAVTATTTTQGQDARLTFTATAGQRVVVQVTSVSNPAATVNLLKPDGTTQASLSINNSPGLTFFIDTQTLATSGTYTLWIAHSSSNTGSETLQLSSVAADFTATIVIGGSPVRVPATGNNALGQNANLTFSATAGQKVSISLSNGGFSSYSACFLTLKNPSGSSVTSGYCGYVSSLIDTVTLSATGTYSIYIDPQGMAMGNTTVTLNNDADLTSTIAIDSGAVTTTTVAGQDARLTFNASAGQRVVLQVTSVTNPGATVYMLKPDGTTQASVGINNGAGQTFFIDTQILAAAGTYTLWVLHSSSNFGSETLQLNSVPADYTATLTINGGAVPVPATGNTALGQNASLTFSATAGQSLKINLSNSTYTPYYGCVLTLKNPSGGSVTSGYCGNGAASPISATAATTGTYTIVIDPQGMATGSVSISVTSP